MNMGYTAAGWTYLADEHHIYGSSRVGVHNTNFILAKRFSTAEMEYTQKTGNQVHFIRGNRNYELSNHLGNVQVVISDKRISVCDNELQTERFEADILMATDYYPFGMAIPERQWYTGSDSSNYRYGFNGQEKDNEVAGNGNSMTAEYWQYDSRLGRRWNIDPVVKNWESGYACFSNIPIVFIDPNGDDVDLSNVSKEVQIKIQNMLNPKSKAFNASFAAVFKNLENDKNTMYNFNELFEPIEGNGNSKVYGNISYGGKNDKGQDVLNIQFTFKLLTYFQEEFSLLEETYHAEQFRTGKWGFAKGADGKEFKVIGLDYYDEAEAKIWAISSYKKRYSEEEKYMKIFKKQGLEGIVEMFIKGTNLYAGLLTEPTTAEKEVKSQLNDLEASSIYDEEGCSKLKDTAFRKPE